MHHLDSRKKTKMCQFPSKRILRKKNSLRMERYFSGDLLILALSTEVFWKGLD